MSDCVFSKDARRYNFYLKTIKGLMKLMVWISINWSYRAWSLIK